MSWTELVFDTPVADHPRLIAGVVGPLLADSDGLFLRELGPDGDARLLVQLRDAAPDLAVPGALVRQAEVPPLGGPVFAGPALDETTRGFLAATSAVAVDLATAPDRTGVALGLMTAHLAAVARPGDGPPLSFLSFRSHAEAFLATTHDPAATRAAFDARYSEHSAAVETRVRTILRDGDLGAAAPWVASVRAAKPAAAEGFRTGALIAHTEYTREHLRERTDFAGNAFHAMAGASAGLQSYMSGDPEFLASRLMTSLLYVTLHSAGLPLLQRYFLCHTISRACEAVYEVDSLSLLSNLT